MRRYLVMTAISSRLGNARLRSKGHRCAPKHGCLDVFDRLVCTQWESRREVGAGTYQRFTNR
jgi:hypothetical protein